jgi:glutamate racemase
MGGIVQSSAEMIFTSNRKHGLGPALTPFFGGRALA